MRSTTVRAVLRAPLRALEKTADDALHRNIELLEKRMEFANMDGLLRPSCEQGKQGVEVLVVHQVTKRGCVVSGSQGTPQQHNFTRYLALLWTSFDLTKTP